MKKCDMNLVPKEQVLQEKSDLVAHTLEKIGSHTGEKLCSNWTEKQKEGKCTKSTKAFGIGQGRGYLEMD